jgi:predicted dehydrogenase
MGRRHARVLMALPERFRLVGAYDPAADCAPPDGVAVLGSEAEAIARAEVVIVASPVDAHSAAVAGALATGRHVLVEKPMCSNAAEARSLAAGARADARLFVGHSERFNPVIRTLARLLRADPPAVIDLTRVGPTAARGPGVLLNLGVHDFDLARYLTRGEIKLRHIEGPEGSSHCRDDLARVRFESASGAIGSIYVDRTAAIKHRAIRLTTARWIYEGDLAAHRLARTARSTGSRADVPLVHEEPLRAQTIALADALDGELSSARELADGYDGARAVALAEEAAGRRTDEAEKLSFFGSP